MQPRTRARPPTAGDPGGLAPARGARIVRHDVGVVAGSGDVVAPRRAAPAGSFGADGSPRAQRTCRARPASSTFRRCSPRCSHRLEAGASGTPRLRPWAPGSCSCRSTWLRPPALIPLRLNRPRRSLDLRSSPPTGTWFELEALDQGLRRPADDHDRRTLLGKLPGHLFSDAAAPARDDDDVVPKTAFRRHVATLSPAPTR